MFCNYYGKISSISIAEWNFFFCTYRTWCPQGSVLEPPLYSKTLVYTNHHSRWIDHLACLRFMVLTWLIWISIAPKNHKIDARVWFLKLGSMSISIIMKLYAGSGYPKTDYIPYARKSEKLLPALEEQSETRQLYWKRNNLIQNPHD